MHVERRRTTRRRGLWLAGCSAALAVLWAWARHKARAFEDRDSLLEPAPGQRINVDGVTLHYVERGEGTPLVLIHGLGASTFTWRHNIDDLARDFRVVAVDLLGFGYSQRVADADYSLSGHARRIAIFMDRLGIESAVIIGHSLGGLVALHLAAAFPENVRGLILVSPATPREVRALGRTRYLSVLHPFFYAFVYQSRAMRRRALRVLYAEPGSVSDDVVEHYLAMARCKGHQGALARIARAVARDPAVNPGRVSVPVLVLWGERDRLMPPSRASWLLDRLPTARLFEVPGAGHMLPEERPQQFNAMVAEFATRELSTIGR